jgi:hypothetical protein
LELLGTIQYNVVANTTDLKEADKDIDQMKASATSAGVAVDDMGKKVENSAKKIGGSAQQINKAGEAMGKTRGAAQNLGWQLQDVAIQAQMGTSAFTIFSQQGSQLVSTFNPLLGAVIAVGGAIAGVLFTSLMATGKAVEEMADRTESLVKRMDDLNAAQKEVVKQSMRFVIDDQKKSIEELNEVIADGQKEVDALRAGHGKLVTVVGAGRTTYTEYANNTRRIYDAEKEVAANRALLVESQLKLTDLTGETGKKTREQLTAAQQLIKTLQDQQAQLSLTGAALADYNAQKVKATETERGLITMLTLANEITKKINKETEDNARKKEAADKKAAADEERRAEAVKKLNLQMQREVDLFRNTSKEAEVLYDIKAGLIKVTGGLQGAEAQSLQAGAKRIDQMREEIEYIEKLKDWVQAKREQEKTIADTISALEREVAAFGMTADAARKAQLMTEGASEAQADYVVQLEKTVRQGKGIEKMFERLDGFGANLWADWIEGGTDAFESLRKMGLQTIAELAHQALTKPIILNIQQSAMGAFGKGGKDGGNSGSLLSGVGMGGIYAAGAVAVVAAVNSWNKAQDKKFEKMTAAYRQGTQSTGTVLGQINAKSESIAGSMAQLGDLSGAALDVNRDMYLTLQSIDAGINGIASGFARQFGMKGVGSFAGVDEGTTAGAEWANFKSTTDAIQKYLFFGGDAVTNFVDDFMTGLVGKVNKEIYKKKVKVIDSGIKFAGQTLADILTTGAIEAFAYADINTKKKVLGITTSNKVKTQKEDLDSVLLGQFAEVFQGAAGALRQASTAFNLEFDDYIDQLKVDPQKLSLKGLEGDELTAEIEAFFSSTLDKWAAVIVGEGQSATTILNEFQQVGEGAFETVVRLASQLNTFNRYADMLNLKFNAAGFAAVRANQKVAELAGGFDQLNSSMSGYYQNFFSDSERAAKTLELMTNEFKELGFNSVPQSREAFRKLIESLDLTTEAGQKQFAGLINLQGVFAELFPAVEATTKSLAELKREAVEGAYGLLERSVAAQRKIIDGQMDVIEKSLNTSQAVFGALESTLNGLILQSDRTQAATRKQAQSQLATMLAGARGGRLPELDALNRTLSTLSQPSENLFSTFEEYALDFDRTASQIKALQDLTGDRVTTEEKALSELEKQSTFLDEVSEWGRMQVDILNGVDVSVTSVAAALTALTNVLGVSYPTAAQQLTLARISQVSEQTRAESMASSQIAAEAAAAQQAQLQTLNQVTAASQQAIADNTLQIRKMIDKFDSVGVPLRQESIDTLATAIAEATP